MAAAPDDRSEERDQAAETELDRQTEKEERWGLWVWEELDEGCRT